MVFRIEKESSKACEISRLIPELVGNDADTWVQASGSGVLSIFFC